MDKDSFLSVIVPVYNVEKYLRQCVDSIINQTFKNLEIILIDDGSTDGSGAICDEYALRDERIVVVHQKNQGLSKVRFEGVKKASHEYVTFVDSDDWIAENMYEVLFSKISGKNIDLISCGCVRYWNENKKLQDRCVYFPEGKYGRDLIAKEIIPYMLYDERLDRWALDPSLCMKLFRKELLLTILEKSGKYRFYYGEDTAVIFLYMLKVRNVIVTHEYFYFHRRRGEGDISPYFRDFLFLDRLYEVYKFLCNEFSKSEYKTVLIKQLECFFVKSSNYALKKYGINLGKQKNYVFPFDKVKKNSTIVLYGAGTVGTQYYEQVNQLGYCSIICWVDRNYQNCKSKNVEAIEKILSIQFDYVVIANANETSRNEIVKNLEALGVDRKYII